MNPTFIDTHYTNRVIKSVRDAVNGNTWLAVIGQVGAGKTTLFEKLKHFYQDYPNKFVVVDLQRSFETFTISVNFIIKRMIEELAPDSHIPGNAHAKLAALKDILHDARSKGKKIIVMLDEAQVLRNGLLRDIKKVHEISSAKESHLFSIVMFGKNDGAWVRSLKGNEIGLRVRTSFLETLKKHEVIDFAERAWNLRWESGQNGEKAKQIFLKNIGDFSPLYIKEQVSKLYRDDTFKGTITYQLACSVFPQTLADILKKNKITLSHVMKKYTQLTGRHISKSTISIVTSEEPGRAKISSDTQSEIIEASLDAIREMSKSDMDIISAEGLAADLSIAQ